jgi:hypothetical protein
MQVRPAPGTNVRDPHTKRHIEDKPEGVTVPETTYWIRRRDTGDVIEVTATATPPRAARTKEKD